MRHAHIALAATIAGLMVSATPSNAAPGTSRPRQQPTTASSRRSRFFRAVITGNIPMALLPPSWCRTLSPSCARGSRGAGQSWCRRRVRQAVENIATGTAENCVDARYNRPYLGPRP